MTTTKFKHHVVRKHKQTGTKIVFMSNDLLAAMFEREALEKKAIEHGVPEYRFYVTTKEVK
tara:strand:+ start:890 stop:1072 length:183 start_codon:yes stop_codon:yes gene_type:complete